MYSSKITQNIAFVGRQLAYLVDQGTTLDGAFARLSALDDEQRQSDVEKLKTLIIEGRESDDSIGLSSYAMLGRLAKAAKNEGGSITSVVCEFEQYVRGVASVLRSYWAGMAGLLWYLIALAMVATITVSIFAIFILPSFDELFLAFGSRLPTFTETIFGMGNTLAILGMLFSIVVVAVAVWFGVILRRRLQQMAPLASWSTWIPFVGELGSIYNEGLLLNYAQIAINSGVSKDRAVPMAEELVGMKLSNPEVGLAKDMGTLKEELRYQCDIHLIRLTESLVNVRERFGLISKLVLYVVIGAFVIAMYLPIFKMGSVI